MSNSSRDVGKTKNLKKKTMGNLFSIPGASSKKKLKKSTGKMTFWGRSSARDTKDYREGYLGKKDDEELDANVRFYKNEIQSKPDGALIEDILEKWWGDYKLLERHHGYIQWLFPIREDGMNWHAQELQKHEIEKICEDKEAHARVLRAYKMMLDFYGMKLEDDESGKIERAENWEERFKHLNKSFHNYLRITRILKCLGEFEYEHLKKPFIKFILHEAMVEETLPNLLGSCCNYWMDVLRKDSDREEVWNWYEKLDENDKKLKTTDESEIFENEMVKNPEKPTQENSNEELTQEYELDALMESENEENESSKKIGMNDKSENDLKFSDLESSANRNVKEEEESTQVDNNEESAQVNDPENEKDESNKKLILKDDSENGPTSLDLKICANGNVKGPEESAQGNNMKKLSQGIDPDVFLVAENQSKNFKMKDELKTDPKYANFKKSANEKTKEQEESKLEENNDKPTQVDDQDVLGQAENEKNESSNILKEKDESENGDKPENLMAFEIGKEKEQGESEQGNTTVESTHIFGPVDVMKEANDETNENHKKMKDESENELNSANEDILKEREESTQDNIEKSTLENDPDVMIEENERNENSNKLTMKDESENYLKSLNSENDNVKEQESKQTENIEKLAEINDTDILMEAENENNNALKDESKNDGKSANIKSSANEEHEESEQENNVEELTRVHDPDVLMEVDYDESNNKLIINSKSENVIKSVDLKASANEEVQEEKSTEEDNIKKSTHLDDSDQSRKTCGHEVTERCHEHIDSQMEDGQKDSEIQVSSENESVEMTDDSQRQLYSGQTN